MKSQKFVWHLAESSR